MEGKKTSVVKKGLEMRRVVLGTVVPYYITVVNQRQDVRPEVKDQERSWKKPGKMPEAVHTTRNFGKNMFEVVSPSQSVIYEDTKKLETGDLFNFRTRQVDVGGGSTLALGERMSIYLVLSALSFSPLLVI